MTRDDLFAINGGIVKGLVEAIADNCPNAMINMISNPVNSTVPIAAEVLKAKGKYDPKKLFGVTTLDVVRAKTFYAEKAGLETSKVDVPVVGGHAGITILPLFSQATPQAKNLSADDIDALTKRTQDGGTEVVAAKAGKGSATLSMAYAGALFADACLRAKNGEANIVECTYVESKVTKVPYFSSKVTLGRDGVDTVHGLGTLSAYEQSALDAMMPQLEYSLLYADASTPPLFRSRVDENASDFTNRSPHSSSGILNTYVTTLVPGAHSLNNFSPNRAFPFGKRYENTTVASLASTSNALVALISANALPIFVFARSTFARALASAVGSISAPTDRARRSSDAATHTRPSPQPRSKTRSDEETSAKSRKRSTMRAGVALTGPRSCSSFARERGWGTAASIIGTSTSAVTPSCSRRFSNQLALLKVLHSS
ncbi:malate dehydrogenase [Ostreococcus tauri]|uniref:malate dehydrogenase n=2 Tax=Viridiplantae TaxID=33090 RepID=A0A1Y5IFZ3_OSTTA|nr:malate dehydrogenase [Ostreococcus tauri]